MGRVAAQRFSPESTLADLPQFDFTVNTRTEARHIGATFEHQPQIPGVIILDDNNHLAGMISRAAFMEHMYRPFHVELFNRRPVADLVEVIQPQTLQLPASTIIHQAARTALEREDANVYEPIIVEDDQNQLSLVDVLSLLTCQSDLLSQQIRAHERATAAAHRAEAKYRSIFENSPNGIFQANAEGKFLSVNAAMATMFGYKTPRDMLNDDTFDANHMYVDTRRHDQLLRMLRREGTVTGFESQVYRCDHETLRIMENLRAVPDIDGDVAYYEGIVMDMTERRRTEAMRKAKEAAEAASRAKSEFLATMSHEIRTPLNGVIGALDLIGRTNLDPRQERYAEIARSSATNLIRLINDILDFSKIEAGRLELELIDFNLGLLIEEITNGFAQTAAESNLELCCYVSAAAQDTFRGDPQRIRQVLTNLIGNAIKFTSEGSVAVRVDITEGEDNRHILTADIIDTGIGIEADKLQRLFQSFSQVDASTTRQYGGTGLGLAICKRLVEMMGGQINVESTPNKGSTFRFTASLEATDAAVAQPALAVLDFNLRNLRALAVDDHPVNREILHDQLQSWGACVATARNGREAIDSLRRAATEGNPFSFMVLDMDMPAMDGLAVARAVADDPALCQTVIVVLTSLDAEDKQAELLRAGVAAVLTKPARQSVLLEAIMRAMITCHIDEPDLLPAPSARIDDDEAARLLKDANVLLAEDNEINQVVATEILKQIGCNVTLVDNGALAIEAAAAQQFDVILMDCQMPEVDGFAATHRIRAAEADKNAPRTPIVALTANAVKGDREACIDAGMDDYVTKPIDPAALLAAMARVRIIAHHTGSEEPPVIDTDTLITRCMNNPAIAETFLNAFEQHSNKTLTDLQAALDLHDAESLHRLAHGLKGAAANLSAEPLRRLALDIEQRAKTGNLDGLEDTVTALKQQVNACIGAFDKVKQQIAEAAA